MRAIHDAEVRQQLEDDMQSAPPEWQNLVAAQRQILNGERDEDILCERLDYQDSEVVVAILRGIADPETLYDRRQHTQLIVGTVMAINDAEVRQQLESQMENAPKRWQNLIAAIRQILNGERDEDILCEGLDSIDSQIVLAILEQVKK